VVSLDGPVRRWHAASLIVVAALYAGATGNWVLACAVAALIVVALAVGARMALSPLGARVAAGVAAAAGGVLGAALPPAAGNALRAPWPSFALAGLLAGSALLFRSERAKPSTLALVPGLAALTACGEAELGRVYAIVAVTHVAFAVLALGGHRSVLRAVRLPSRELAKGAVLVALAALLAVGFATGLPPVAQWTEARVLHSLGGAEIGFSDRMWLGSLHGMLQSDEVVMRVEGARTDYLRGAVYDHYEFGRWGRRRAPRPVPVPATALAQDGGERVRITPVAGVRDRYFVPLGAAAVVTDPGATVDDFAVLRAVGGAARAVSFETSGPPAFAVVAPVEVDLDVPIGLRAALEHIAASWTLGADGPEAKIRAIAHRLRTEYTYALEFEHHKRRDPLLDFLLDDHRGHCEYFASAMTLLARAAGVPARVAIGYRVAEENTLGGYWVVRERNAHAWSEVFLPGRGFVTIDATPDGAVAQNEPHRQTTLRALWDLLGATWGRATTNLGLVHLGGSMVAVFAVGLFARRIRQRRAPKEAAGARASFARPPPSLARLLDVLAQRGAARPAWESLEHFADRLRDPSQAQAAEAIRNWAALRYGGLGSQEAIVREMEEATERLQRG
jgi:hypothetical protein